MSRRRPVPPDRAAPAGGRAGPVVGVIGGSGGVGASSLAAVLALVAGRSVLVDLDCAGGGIDVVLGAETLAGARWSGLQIDGGRLAPDVLARGLPAVGDCAVLAADTAAIDPAAVEEVLRAAAQVGAVVLDLPRADTAARVRALACCDLVVVLARSDVAGLVAAHAVVDGLRRGRGVAETGGVGVVLRRGAVEPAEGAHLIGLPLLGVLPALTGTGVLVRAARPPRALVRVADGVLRGVRTRAVPPVAARELQAVAS